MTLEPTPLSSQGTYRSSGLAPCSKHDYCGGKLAGFGIASCSMVTASKDRSVPAFPSSVRADGPPLHHDNSQQSTTQAPVLSEYFPSAVVCRRSCIIPFLDPFTPARMQGMKCLYLQLVLTKKTPTFSQDFLQVAELRLAVELRRVNMQNVKASLLPFLLLSQWMT